MNGQEHQNPKIYTYKDKQFDNQFQAVYWAFYDGAKSMFEVEVETGIRRENICWFVGDLRRNGKIFFVEKRRCKYKRSIISALTTNPEFKPEDNQLNLFL